MKKIILGGLIFISIVVVLYFYINNKNNTKLFYQAKSELNNLINEEFKENDSISKNYSRSLRKIKLTNIVAEHRIIMDIYVNGITEVFDEYEEVRDNLYKKYESQLDENNNVLFYLDISKSSTESKIKLDTKIEKINKAHMDFVLATH
jgi:hypothetical protein